MPPSRNQNPINQPPDDTTPQTSIPSQPPKPRANRNTKPKLSTAHFTNPQAMSSALSIGRRYAARVDSQTHDPATLLSSFLDRMSQWSSNIEPDLELPEFVVAAQALGGNRELKQFLTNIRLAELRQVTNAWRTVQEEKRDKKRRKRMVKIEDDDSDHPDPPHEHTDKPPTPPRTDDQREDSGYAANTHDQTSKQDYRSTMMKDPDVLARIERNRRMALEKRLAAQKRRSVQGAPTSSISDKQPAQPKGPESMGIDPNDVFDPQEDVDLAVLDEMEASYDQAARPQPCSISPGKDAGHTKKSLHVNQRTELRDKGTIVEAAKEAARHTTEEETEKQQTKPPSASAGKPSQGKDNLHMPLSENNLSAAEEPVKTCDEATRAAMDDLMQSNGHGLNVQSGPIQRGTVTNPANASDSSKGIPSETSKAESDEKRDPSQDGHPSSDPASTLAAGADQSAPAATTTAANCTAAGKETEEDVDMDILQEFEAGVAEDY